MCVCVCVFLAGDDIYVYTHIYISVHAVESNLCAASS